MTRKTLATLVAAVVLLAAYGAYTLWSPSQQTASAPVSPVETQQAAASQAATAEAEAVSPAPENVVPAAATVRDRLLIDVAGSVSGTIEIELLNDIAPEHVARIEALAKAGKYDNVVFHRVIDGFMAQTGDVEFGVRNSANIGRAGMGSSDMPDLRAEFSKEKFVTGTVGMARAASVDSANSQFFIMFGEAPYLDGQYTVVGHVVAGQKIVNALRKGDSNNNGAVDQPDYMKSVRVSTGQ